MPVRSRGLRRALVRLGWDQFSTKAFSQNRLGQTVNLCPRFSITSHLPGEQGGKCGVQFHSVPPLAVWEFGAPVASPPEATLASNRKSRISWTHPRSGNCPC